MDKQVHCEAKLRLESVEPSELVVVQGGAPLLVVVIIAELFALGFVGGMILHDATHSVPPILNRRRI